MKKILCALMCLSALAGCSKESLFQLEKPSDAQTEYIIPAGEHASSQSKIKKVDGAALRFTVIFDSSCIYTTQKPENQGDINKLYGFSDNGTNHHVNSARVGWRWFNNRLELFAYCYASKARYSSLLGTIAIGEEAELAIIPEAGKYVFTLKGKLISMDRTPSEKTIKGYKLYPYFGGDETAPHEIKIQIRELGSETRVE